MSFPTNVVVVVFCFSFVVLSESRGRDQKKKKDILKQEIEKERDWILNGLADEGPFQMQMETWGVVD